jgi:hypothetical protein
MGRDLLDKHWKWRLEHADRSGSPLYVTPEDYRWLQDNAVRIENERMPWDGTIGHWPSTPVVVDREKAAEQEADAIMTALTGHGIGSGGETDG